MYRSIMPAIHIIHIITFQSEIKHWKSYSTSQGPQENVNNPASWDLAGARLLDVTHINNQTLQLSYLNLLFLFVLRTGHFCCHPFFLYSQTTQHYTDQRL